MTDRRTDTARRHRPRYAERRAVKTLTAWMRQPREACQTTESSIRQPVRRQCIIVACGVSGRTTSTDVEDLHFISLQSNLGCVSQVKTSEPEVRII